MNFRSASFTLSLDVEMAWGSWRDGKWPEAAFEAEPAVVKQLDALAVANRTPFSFGVVGALAGIVEAKLRSTEPSAGIDVIFPDLAGRYYPGTIPTVGRILENPGMWLSSEVVGQLRVSTAGHEVCSHSFFHTLPRTGTDMVADVKATREALGDFSSLIFPKDGAGFLDALENADVTTYRGTGESRYMRNSGKPRHVGRIVHLLDQAIGRPAPLAQRRSNNVTCLTTSAYLTLRTGVRRRIPAQVLRRRFITPLHEAVRQQGNYHLWTHPWNLALGGSDGFELLAEVITTASDLQQRGDLRVKTMRQLSEEA